MEIKAILFWVLVVIFAAPSFSFGFAKLTAKPDKAEQFKKWGYSQSFMRWLGLVEMVATLGIIFPITRLVSVAIWTVILLGAIYTNLRHRDKELITALIVSVQMGFIAWLGM
ncbi:MAG: DoxX family protein [Spirosomataceae bacterium]